MKTGRTKWEQSVLMFYQYLRKVLEAHPESQQVCQILSHLFSTPSPQWGDVAEQVRKGWGEQRALWKVKKQPTFCCFSHLGKMLQPTAHQLKPEREKLITPRSREPLFHLSAIHIFGVQCRALSQQSDLPWGWQAQLLAGSCVPTHPPSLLWGRHRNPSPFSVLQQKNPPPNWWLWWKPVRFPTPYSNTTSHLFFLRSYTSHTPAPGPAFANLEIFLFLTVPQGTGNPLQHLAGLCNSPACSPRCIPYKDECTCCVSAQELQTQISVPQAKGAEPALTSPLWGGSLQLSDRRRVQDPLASALPRASCSCSQWGQQESFVSLTKTPWRWGIFLFSLIPHAELPLSKPCIPIPLLPTNRDKKPAALQLHWPASPPGLCLAQWCLSFISPLSPVQENPAEYKSPLLIMLSFDGSSF